MTRVNGVNPKAWFYGFARDLGKRSAHVRRALAGSAAEQWLNMELNAYLHGVLPDGLYVYPESDKRDLTIFHFADRAHHEREHRGVAVIETKVVYRNYSPGKIAGQVKTLARQLDRAEKAYGAECRTVGLVLGVWADWNNVHRPLRFKEKRKQSLSGFRRIAGDAVRGAATERGFRAMKPAFETMVSPASVAVGPWNVEIALVGQYFMR